MENEKNVVDLIEEKETQEKWFKKFLISVFDIIAFFIFVLWIVLLIRIFLFNPFTVVWHSMDPTFKESDFIVVDKMTPRFSDFERGDIVVFVPPKKDVSYIKRIVWMPWEVVKLDWGYVYICDEDWENCKELDEPYLQDQWITSPECNISEFAVTTWAYFVLWDNRNQSTDSRCCFGLGCYDWSDYLLSEEDILWKVSIRLFPSFSKF